VREPSRRELSAGGSSDGSFSTQTSLTPLQSLGPHAQVFLLAIGGSIQLCITGDVYAQYEEVRRPRFRPDEEVIAATFQTIRERSFEVKSTGSVQYAAIPTTISSSNVQKRPTQPLIRH